jgi:hypothetical protein
MTDDDITTMDDPQFLAERRRVREEVEHLPPHQVHAALTARHRELTDEFLRRARIAWTQAIQEKTPVNSTPATIALPADARLLAVEVLLADPEALGNDALEGDLYILRDQLRGNQTDKPVSR